MKFEILETDQEDKPQDIMLKEIILNERLNAQFKKRSFKTTGEFKEDFSTKAQDILNWIEGEG